MHVSEAESPTTPALEGGAPARLSAGARSRAATRQRLLESGKALFAERGLRRVTTHDIARNAGVAAGTFYLHFSDKRELFRELALEALAAWRARFTAQPIRQRPYARTPRR